MVKNVFGLILAGGSGTALWPLSREFYPKQLQKFNQKYTLFQSTFINLVDLIDDKNIISVTNANIEKTLLTQLSELQQKFCRDSKYKILTEPLAKDTAPAIALSAKYILEVENAKNAILVVVPADCTIYDNKKFIDTVENAINLAKKDYLVLIGTKITSPVENKKYIKTQPNKQFKDTFDVVEFRESVSASTVKNYVKAGNYYSYSGIFVAKASVFLEKIEKTYPEILTSINSENIQSNSPTVEKNIFEKIPTISFDEVVRKNFDNTLLLSMESNFNSLTNWNTIYNTLPKDTNNNSVVGQVKQYKCENSLFYSTSKLVAAVGIKNIFVVETPDALLVCNRSKVDDVKKIYTELLKQNDETCKNHQTVFRPWGYYTVLDKSKNTLIKIIIVKPHSQLSLQRHKYRAEHWVILEGNALVVLNNKEYNLKSGESVNINVMDIHSVCNQTDNDVKILEVQKGSLLDENDIERLKDIYGRA